MKRRQSQPGPDRRRCLRTALYAAVVVGMLQFLGACDYARMIDDEALNTYQEKMPPMSKKVVPVSDGLEWLRVADPKSLKNPVKYDPQSIQSGRVKYETYCSQCHGPEAKGFGTVGQSFAPLPTDLHSQLVRRQSDGELFYKISLGFKRHPPLAYTVAEADRWAIVNFMRSLGSDTVKTD